MSKLRMNESSMSDSDENLTGRSAVQNSPQPISDEEVGASIGSGRDLELNICSLGYETIKTYFPEYLDRCFGKYK